jgi:hypothetical protein
MHHDRLIAASSVRSQHERRSSRHTMRRRVRHIEFRNLQRQSSPVHRYLHESEKLAGLTRDFAAQIGGRQRPKPLIAPTDAPMGGILTRKRGLDVQCQFCQQAAIFSG